MDLVIFGAQGMALGAYEAIHGQCPARHIRCFLVTERRENAESLSGLPVMELDAFASSLSAAEKKTTEILIATPENVMPAIEESLDSYGLHCHVRLTSLRWAELLGYHYMCRQNFMPLSALPVGYHKAKVYMAMAKHYKDKPLSGSYTIPDWVIPVQVGAALCGERVAGILDSDGENISARNGNYSELTALYWIWKHWLSGNESGASQGYYGLVHYRRILELSEDDILRLADNGVDVVLPYPMPYQPDINAHHERYLKREDWDAVCRAVEELYPAYAEQFPHVLGQKYFYNYNIMLARKQVLEEYCNWLFPILARVEELSVPKGSARADRYIGYVGETLATLYFMVNRGSLRIVHAGCRFLA